MRYVALVEDAAEEVNEDGDDTNDGKDSPWTDGLLCGLSRDTGSLGEYLEVIGAFVWVGADEGRNSLGCEGVFIAVEGDDSRFPPGGRLGRLLVPLLVLFVIIPFCSFGGLLRAW